LVVVCLRIHRTLDMTSLAPMNDAVARGRTFEVRRHHHAAAPLGTITGRSIDMLAP
jgi:hypothetical protein